MGASRHILFLNTLPVFLWRHSGMFAEDLAEGRLVGEMKLIRYLLDGVVGLAEQNFRFCYQNVVYPFYRPLAAVCFRNTREIARRHT